MVLVRSPDTPDFRNGFTTITGQRLLGRGSAGDRVAAGGSFGPGPHR
jgi:hypothetical protein